MLRACSAWVLHARQARLMCGSRERFCTSSHTHSRTITNLNNLFIYLKNETILNIFKACSWNGKLYYDGDRWKENGVDFYCSSASEKVRPGCYVEAGLVNCTGAISGWCPSSPCGTEKERYKRTNRVLSCLNF